MKVTRTIPDGVKIVANGVVVTVMADERGLPHIKIIPNEEYEVNALPMVEGGTGYQLQMEIALVPRAPERSQRT